MACLSDDVVFAYLEGTLAKEVRTSVEQHLDGCSPCRMLLSDVAKAATMSGEAGEPGQSQAPLGPGSMIEHFQVIRLLGRGGMGEVYLARDTRLSRKVALKVINPLSLGSPEALDRFLFEARATAQFNHPHIVTIYAVGQQGDCPYMALEYLEGLTLRAVMNHGKMSLAEGVRIGLGIATALAEAHKHHVLHRDLTPKNVILARDGRLRVLDFGLAKLLLRNDLAPKDAADLSAAVSSSFPSLRPVDGSDQSIRGTPGYMAPEQWQAAACTGATDVWALGILLYEMLSGRHPYAKSLASSLLELSWEVSGPEPAPRLPVLRKAPPDLPQLIAACLNKDAAKRPSISEVVDRLARISGTQRGRFTAWHGIGLALGAAGAVLLGLVGPWRHLAPSGPNWLAIPSGTLASLTGIWGAGPRDIWAVGRTGALVHWDGATWTGAPSGTSEHLLGVWGSSPTDVWVVGERGTVLRQSGGSWHPLPSGTSERLDGVWGTSAGSVLVVGQNGVIRRWDGSNFFEVPRITQHHLRGIWGTAHNDIWAVGGADDRGVIVHFDGSRFTKDEVPVRLKGIGGRGPADVWAVGGTTDSRAVVYHYDGKRWSQLPLRADKTAETSWLQALWADRNRVWIVGDSGTILSQSGGTWYVSPTSSKVNFRGVWGSGAGEIWAVGTDGVIWRTSGY